MSLINIDDIDVFDNTEIKQETNMSFNEEDLNFNECDLNCSNDNNSNNSFICENQNDNNIDENINFDIKIKKKLTKDDLNKIPLTIFDCIFCANENISFNHLINEKLNENYLYCTSYNDINIINDIIKRKKIKDKNNNNNNKNKKIIKKIKEKILYNSEYLFKFYKQNESLNYLKKKCIGLNENNLENTNNNNNNDNNNEKIDYKESKLQKLINQNLCRKIKFEDIDFEPEPFDIWECNFSEKEDNINKNIYNNVNNNFYTLKVKDKLSSSFNDLECSYSTLLSSPSSKENKSYKEKNKNLSFLFYLK